MTGRPIVEGSADTMAGISLGDVDLAFRRIDDYRPPGWPDGEHPKRYHLDFEVLTTDHPCRLVIATPTWLHAAARSGDPRTAGT